MNIPFYRNLYIFDQGGRLQVEYFDYGTFTQVVISQERDNMLILGSGADKLRKRAFHKAYEQFKQREHRSFITASIGERQIKL